MTKGYENGSEPGDAAPAAADEQGFGTKAVHAGESMDASTGAVIAPVRRRCLWL